MNYQDDRVEAENLKIGWLWTKILTLSTFVLLVLVIGGMLGCPRYKVYQQNLEGKAELAKATQNRQIRIQEAMAKYEAAHFDKQSDSVRACGVAIANHIIGESLQNNEGYLRWLWITDVAGANVDKTIVYIPTETNLPLLEANRFKPTQQILNQPTPDPSQQRLFGIKK